MHRGLQQLVAAEFLYQQGLPPQATYRFKHALIQEAAYQSLLRSTRQQYHLHIAQVLEARFPEICETQPELLAHHYTQAGLSVQAIPTGSGPASGPSSAQPIWKPSSTSDRGWRYSRPCPDTPERASARTCPASGSGNTVDGDRRASHPPRWSVPMLGHGRCVCE